MKCLFALTCHIRPDAMPALKQLRVHHLAYIQDRIDSILFGGPIRAEDGSPVEMIIILRHDDLDAARAFIAAEPYNASGEVFNSVQVRRWSQVAPEVSPGALAKALADERRAATSS